MTTARLPRPSNAPPPRKRKARRMTPHTAVIPADRPRIADLARDMVRKLSARAHATADDRARALGWTVTQTPGWLGLSGRSYRDPRFAARHQDALSRRDGCHE